MASPLEGLGENFMVMDLGHGMTGPVGLLGETFVEYATGAGVGYVYQAHRDKFVGRHAATIAAVAGKGLAVLSCLAMGGEANVLSGAFNAVGSAGVALKGLEHGLGFARKRAKVRAIVVDEKAALPAGAKEVTTVGALPPAPAGNRAMSWEAIEQMSRMH